MGLPAVCNVPSRAIWRIALLVGYAPYMGACQHRYVANPGMPTAYISPQGADASPTSNRATIIGKVKDWIVYADGATPLYKAPGGVLTGERLAPYSAHMVVAESDSCLQLCDVNLAEKLPNNLIRLPNKDLGWARKRDLILWQVALQPAGIHGPQRVVGTCGAEHLAKRWRSATPRIRASIDSGQWAGSVPGGGQLRQDAAAHVFYVIKTKADSLLLASSAVFTQSTAAKRLLGWYPASAFSPYSGHALRLRLRSVDSLRAVRRLLAAGKQPPKQDRDLYLLDTLLIDSAQVWRPYVYAFRYPKADVMVKKKKAAPPQPIAPSKQFIVPVISQADPNLVATLLPLAGQPTLPDSLAPAGAPLGSRPSLQVSHYGKEGQAINLALRCAMRPHSLARLYKADTGYLLEKEELTALLDPITALNITTIPARPELAGALTTFYTRAFADNGMHANPDSLKLGALFAHIGYPTAHADRRIHLASLHFADLADTAAVPEAEYTTLVRGLAAMVQICETKALASPMPIYAASGTTMLFLPAGALRLKD